MKKAIAVVVAMVLLLTACAPAPTVEAEREVVLATAVDLLTDALAELYLYQGEILVNSDTEPYRTPDGRKYYPVLQYRTVAELRSHSRKIFTEDFCTNVLDIWTHDPRGLRFVEHDGKMWETNSIGNMGWIILLVPSTIEIVSLEGDRCVLSAYSQVLTGEVVRTEFLMLREPEGWRLDSYYEFNHTLPTEAMGATVSDYLAELSGGDDELYRLVIRRGEGSSNLDVDSSMIPPFASILAALEYDEATVTVVDAVPKRQGTGHDVELEIMIYSGSCEISGYDDGSIYITKPDGEIVRLSIPRKGGIRLLADVIDAARWKLRDIGR